MIPNQHIDQWSKIAPWQELHKKKILAFRAYHANLLLLLATVHFTTIAMNTESNKISCNTRLEKIFTLVRDLKKKNMLDGEILIVEKEQTLLHEMGQTVRFYQKNDSPPQFMIGSVSKTFTAVALLLALYDESPGENDQEKCAHVAQRVHEPIIRFLPPDKFSWGASIPEWADEVTLHHLLTHTSGIVQHIRLLFETEGFEAVQSFIHRGHGPEYIIQRWGHEPLDFPAGSKFSYSNLGYELLAKAISIMTQMPFEEYLRTRLFEPYRLFATHHPNSGKSNQLSSLPHLIHLVPEMLYNGPAGLPYLAHTNTLPDIGFAQGSGGIITTADDLVRWQWALHDKKEVLPQPLYELLIKPNKNGHGYGIFNRDGILSYTGKIGAYTALTFYVPQHQLSIIVLCHIDQDEAAVFQQQRALDLQLRETISDEKARHEHIGKLLMEKYPPVRGSAELISLIMQEFPAPFWDQQDDI